MRHALILSVLVSGASAQYCTCSRDDTNGYWTGQFPGDDNCTQCDTRIVDDTPPGNATCTVKDICRDLNRPLQELLCFGAGTCVNNPAAPCNCTNPNQEGRFCERCKPGFQGWPGCTTADCAAPASGSPTCNLHGSCVTGNTPVSCGVGGPGCSPSNLAACQSVGYIPNLQVCSALVGGVVQALTLGPGESACGTKTCPFGSKCVNVVQEVCCESDRVACSGPNTAQRTQCCHKSQKCCDGACCSSFEACTAYVGRDTIPEAAVNTIYVNGNPIVVGPTDPRYTQAWGGGPLTDWKMRDGTTVTPWRICTTDTLGGVAISRVIVLPSSLVLALIIAAALVYITAGLRPVMVAVPAFLLLLCSLFIFFTPFWYLGVLIALGALCAIGTVHKGGRLILYGLVFQFFALAVICGGLGVGFVMGHASQGLFFTLSGSRGAGWTQLNDCANFYDFFRVDNNNRPYDMDPDQQFTNYCSTGWYSYLLIIAACVVFLQIVLLAASGRAWLKNESGEKKSVA